MPREILTPRLRLRRWLPGDRAPFAAMNADPRVMEYFPKALTREESDALIERIEAHFEQRGFGLWAVEIRGGARFAGSAGAAATEKFARAAGFAGATGTTGFAPFAGFIGLSVPRFQAHFTPCVEIGWRLAAEHWGHGYATEGARAVLDFGFEALGLEEIVSFTAEGNARSRRVMEKIGMTRNPADDFDHPSLPEGHPLRRHVLYRIVRPADDSISEKQEESPDSSRPQETRPRETSLASHPAEKVKMERFWGFMAENGHERFIPCWSQGASSRRGRSGGSSSSRIGPMNSWRTVSSLMRRGS